MPGRHCVTELYPSPRMGFNMFGTAVLLECQKQGNVFVTFFLLDLNIVLLRAAFTSKPLNINMKYKLRFLFVLFCKNTLLSFSYFRTNPIKEAKIGFISFSSQVEASWSFRQEITCRWLVEIITYFLSELSEIKFRTLHMVGKHSPT